MKNILFVDERRKLLEGLYDNFASKGDDWSVHFAVNGPNAASILEHGEIDIVVSGLYLMHDNSLQFMDFLAQEYPNIIRLSIEDPTSPAGRFSSVNGHRNFTLPININELENTIEKSYRLKEILAPSGSKKIVSSLVSIPKIPPIYSALMENLENRVIPLEAIDRIFSEVPEIINSVLQIINSPLFNLSTKIYSPQEAIHVLGTEIVLSLVLMIELHSIFKTNDKHFSTSNIAEHSLITALLTKTILEEERVQELLIDETYSAAVLHDFGKLILSSSFPNKYSKILEISNAFDRPLHEVEQEILGTTHSVTGAFLLGLWGLPENLVEAIAFHHTPQLSKGDSSQMLSTLHIANSFSYEFVPDFAHSGTEQIDELFQQRMGISERWGAWHSICENKLKEIGFIL